jgi:dTDP-4-dehydrorhamnose 3,5-epimerase
MSKEPSNLPKDNAIHGVIFKPLKSFPDNRGFFREIFRCSEPIFEGGRFAQWSHSKMQKNVVKAWHYHHVQIDWWYVPLGQIETVLFDNRPESPTYRTKLTVKMGDPEEHGPNTFASCVRIPPGVLHACKVLSEEAHLFYITSETYNPNEEGRLPYNSEVVGHDWGCDAIVAENDRRTFVPTSTRVPVPPA